MERVVELGEFHRIRPGTVKGIQNDDGGSVRETNGGQTVSTAESKE